MHSLLNYARDNSVDLTIITYDFNKTFQLRFSVAINNCKFEFRADGADLEGLLDEGYAELCKVMAIPSFAEADPKRLLLEAATTDQNQIVYRNADEDDVPF